MSDGPEDKSKVATRSSPITHHSSPRSLADWLAYQEKLHPNTIDLGLDRLRRVLAALNWQQPECPVLTVGGTNGKGSTVALLEAILSAAGYRIGTFTSPHLIRYTERIRIAKQEVSQEALVAAFERIEQARGTISLTFFEFNTLAALLLFGTERLDAIVLEVGLGGRLDAVNVVDADVAIVTSVSLDHCEWLGFDVESIGREKAGIFRNARPAIYGSRAMPQSIPSEVARVGAKLKRLGTDFDFEPGMESWNWRTVDSKIRDLPLPALPGPVQLENAATTLAALEALRSRLSIERRAIEKGLREMTLQGRFQVIRRGCEWILDVAHNPAAAQVLARGLVEHKNDGRTIGLCGVLKDKDVTAIIAAVIDEIDEWIIAGLASERALAPHDLATRVQSAGGQVIHIAADVKSACEQANSVARTEDRVVVFGSFYSVGPALEWLSDETRDA